MRAELMAIEVPEGVQGLFLVLTGERWPTADEDAWREVGNAWGTAGDRLENELGPYMVQVVPPEKRFVIDDGGVRGPLRPWHHVVHAREPIALAARAGLGRGIVRETPGLQDVYREVRNSLAHQMRSAGVAGRLSANDRQHLARVLAMKFGVPGLRGAYPALIDGGVSHEVRVGDHIFTAALDAELRELDLNARGITGVRVGLAATSAVSDQLAAMVADHHGRSWAGTKADAFQQVLAKIVPSGRRYGVAERILRSGTQTFLEAQTRTMLSKRGLPIPLPPTPDGWRQELRIRLRAFNPAHENTVEGATLEQYSEADLRFGEENSVVDGADAAGGLGGVFRIGGTPAAEGERTTSQKSASQVSGGLTVGGGLSRGRHTGDLGGSLDLNLGTYAGDSEQAGADAVYTIEYRRWRRKRTPRFGRVGYTTTRHVRVEHGLEVLAPYVRAADLGLPEPVDRPRRDLPVKGGERYYLDRDLGMAVAHVEHVGADGVLDAIEEILGDRADPEVLGAVQSAFSEDAVRAQFGIARKGGIQQVIKTPTVPRRGLPRLLPERARPPYPAGPDGRAPVGRGPVPGREPPDVAPLVPARKGDAGDPRGAGPGDRPGPHAPHDPGQAGCDPGQARLGGRLPSPRTPAVAARGGVRRARAGAVDARRRGAALVGARRRAWRRIDHRAAAHGVEPVVAEFAPGTQDGLTLAIALGERNLRANVAPLLEGVYGVPLMDGSHLTVQLVPTRARWLSRGDYIALNFPEHAEEPERETEESRGWSGGAEFDLGHPVGHPLAEGAERPLLDPGLAYDGGSKRVRVKANSTGDYVEYNRQRDGGYDYYLFDATWLVTGAHGHTVNVPIPNGFTGMLPAAVVQRLLAEDPDLALEAPPPSAE